ncbi:sentrin-specific protease 1, putative [Plasmodium gallinaceum]|uniref:Sentrin-specific protease 1, putative n=1 Tax=Plasmodium gallinaceum TaxID=5849 RepID=A0A1J1GWY6_PLAGA|nr:sentrin-specific protease 1, putative [Plasmodium gallinaceum]CRG96975.1 sentrin-specific protease 1, putative [Plasmodium gallinaceum]
MSKIEWNIKDLFEKDKNNNENKKKINKCNKEMYNEETYNNESYFFNENDCERYLEKKTNQTLENNHYFIFKRNRNSLNESNTLNNRLNKQINQKEDNRLIMKRNNNLDKNNDSYIDSNNDGNSNKSSSLNKETKPSRLIWKCVKNVYTSFTSAVKKNIFIYDKNLESDNISKEKSISNNSRLIDKKQKNKKHKDILFNESSIFLKKKNDFLSDEYMNKNVSYDNKIIKEKNLKNGILIGNNKNKNDELEEKDKNKKIKNCYDFLEGDIKNLFASYDYEKVEYSNDNIRISKQDIQRKHNNCKNKNKNNIHMHNVKRYNSSYNDSSNLSSYEYNFNKFNKDDKLSRDHLESNLKFKKKEVHNIISNSYSKHSLHNLYNSDINSNECFFLQSSGDENINKNEIDYFITEKKNESNNSDSNSTKNNKKKDYHNMHYKDNVFKMHLHVNNKKYSSNDSDRSFSNSNDKCVTKRRGKKISNINDQYFTKKENREVEKMIKHANEQDEKNKNFEELYYDNIFKNKNKKNSSTEKNCSWSKNSRNTFSNKKYTKDEVINITDNEEEYTYNELYSNDDILENENKCLKNKGKDNDYGNIEIYNSFIKNNEEIKKMRNEYKSLIQLIDTFIDESLNGNCLSNSIINKQKTYKNEQEKKHIINKEFNKDEESMKVIDGVYGDNKNKYIILKYDEDSLIEALEKLRIDKEKKKAEEKEEEEKKKKITKIDKSVFYKCYKKDQHETAIFILSEKNENKVLIEKFNVPLLYSQIKCLIDTRWLNDEVINFYLSMLQEYNEQQFKNNSSYFPKIFTFSTFFFLSLSSNGCYNYCKVSRWTKRKKVDIFSFDLILIPLHIGGNHWTLGAINIKDKKIKLYDSLNMPNKKFFEYIRRYIIDEAKDKKKIDIDISTWKYNKDGNSEMGIPYQENGYDCGVFTCMFAKCLSFNREFDFTQNDIKEIRLKMVYEISQGYLTF